MDSTSLDRLTTQIMSAAIAPDRWQAVIEEISRALPGTMPHLYGVGLDGRRGPFTLVTEHDPYWVDLYERHFAALNVWGPRLAQAPAGTVMRSSEMCPEHKLLGTEFYADWVRPQGDARGGGGAVIAQTEGATLLLGGSITQARRDTLEPAWMSLLHRLLPSLRQAWQVNRRLAEASIESAGTAVAEGKSAAICVIDPDEHILFANAEAERLLAAGSPIRRDMRNRLRCAARPPGRPLPMAPGLAGTMLRDAQGARWQVWTGDLAPDVLDDWHAALTLGLDGPRRLFVLAPMATSPDLVARLQATLGLTQAEAEITLALTEGHLVEEIAQDRGVSVHTVRNQIKTAVGRCGLRRQLDLAVCAARLCSASVSG
ncbi:hypothetical protein SAMN04490244_102298 [Tranquillimonas rosea]|uniref:HTH luxR-type domain-containing protein n=1 Tax=Tranquillimonas rosea TaxID=641238 RepID=A0A1H9RIU3_9RHOB|nr:hypothetical protein [Tranquillimonas rosea]SER72547.1 hypothetical protein SAMN04490244_102298 [Tranquillimonas rosea]